MGGRVGFVSYFSGDAPSFFDRVAELRPTRMAASPRLWAELRRIHDESDLRAREHIQWNDRALAEYHDSGGWKRPKLPDGRKPLTSADYVRGRDGLYYPHGDPEGRQDLPDSVPDL